MYNESAIASGIVQFGTFDSGVGAGGSEVVAFEAATGRLYVTNGEEDRIDIIDTASFTLVTSIDLSGIPDFGGINSVAVSGGQVSVAVELDPLDDGLGNLTPQNGVIARFDTTSFAAIDQVVVGNLPDQISYSADGTLIYVANEGEADDAFGDPQGGISIITVATGAVQTFDFTAFDGQEDALRAAGVRIFDGRPASEDFEPEYIAESEDGSTLFVVLQENNAVAVFDIATSTFTDILSLGTSDHSMPGFGIDASDRDDAISIRNWPVQGLRMPDGIASFDSGGTTYFVTANEGDDRGEDERIADITLDPASFANPIALQVDERLGRLGISSIDGDTDGDGDFDQLFSYGSRSFTVFDAAGNVVFDSGSQFEEIVASLRVPNAFNNDDFPTDADDVIDENRSDNKGPEPEAIAVGEVGGVDFIFVGLERDGGIMIYRADDPTAPELAAYVESAVMGDVSPEIIEVIDATDSSTGNTQLAISYEISGTTTVIDLASAIDERATAGGDLTGSLLEDIIRGEGGSNSLWGGGSRDIINGREGNDVITGGFGNDLLVGGAGADTFRFDLYEGTRDVIADFEDGDMIDLTETGMAAADLILRDTSATSTVARIGDDLRMVILHDAAVAVDATDFIFV
ncbi:MAG: choice-of-anchor I family protein [Pseudomonadota bacterium]